MTAVEWAVFKAGLRAPPDQAEFEAWMAKVDAVLVKKCGLDSSDLPDWMYRDAFEDGASPASAAKEALKAAKEF